MSEWFLPLALVLGGATVGAVLWWLRRGAQRLDTLQQALFELNERAGHDPLVLLAQAEFVLARVGITGVRWTVDWYGDSLSGQAGCAPPAGDTPTEWDHDLVCGSLRLRLWLAGAHLRGEQRYFAQALARTLLLLLASDLWRHDALVQASLARLARLKTLLTHDVKNLAQFVQWLADQLQRLQPAPATERSQIEPLAAAAQHARRRAERIVRALRDPEGAVADRAQPLSLARAAQSAAAAHAVPLACTGDATVWGTAEALDTVLDNLMKNLADAARREARAVRAALLITACEGQAEARLYDPGAGPAPPLHRLFEPLYSTDPAGLGLGLWSARLWAQSQGGALRADTDAAGRLVMVLRWPLASQATAPTVDKI